MSVKTEHPEYRNKMPLWARCRAAAEGQDAVQDAGEEYLPMLSGQEAKEYEAYKNRASFYNATWRTVSGLLGMVFRRPALGQFPEVVKPMLKDVSLSGNPLDLLVKEAMEEALIVGRLGIFVDYPVVIVQATAADAKRLNHRPTMKLYETESIINWRYSVVRNATVLSRVVLAEEVTVDVSEFVTKEKTQYRVLDLAPLPNSEDTNLYYRVRVFEVNDKGEDVLTEGPFYPKANNAFLEEIPFYPMSTDDLDCDCDVPPLIDLVNVNMSHYRTSADYEHGCHFTGLPTPVISGYTPTNTNESFGIGSTTAWVFPNPAAKAGYLEFTGQGLTALETNMKNKEAQMAVLGARMLDTVVSSGNSSETTSMNMNGEQSTLATIARVLSTAMERALTMFARFAGSTELVKYELNRNFFPQPMTPLALTALCASWQNGAISYDTLFENLQRGEVVDVDRTIEDELKKMSTHEPVIPGGTQVNQSAKPVHEVTAPTNRQLQTPP